MSAKATAPGAERLRACLAELGLNPPVTLSQVKAAYRERSRLLHPDRNDSPDATEAMARLSEAYRELESYMTSFRYRFDDAEFYEQRPRERIKRQFANSEEWGPRLKRRKS